MANQAPRIEGIANVQAARPRHPLPIVIIGAGGIVREAHLPAYRKADYPVVALVDPDQPKAQALADAFDIPIATASLHEALSSSELNAKATAQLIFDVAVPAKALLPVLEQIPDGSAVLMQKPMGETLSEAVQIFLLCRRKHLKAAVNFQLRWSPVMLAAEEIYKSHALGKLHDIEIHVSTYMPWQLWTFLRTAPRLEILYHSIHYIDLIRAWLGNPERVYAKTIRNPCTDDLSATKSAIILDYGDWVRAVITTNHGQNYSAELQHSYVQWEGTSGVMRAQMGVNLDYPTGKPDTLQFAQKPLAKLQEIPIAGNWFPDAFIGSMGSLQRFVTGESKELPTSVEDAIDTMRTVEAAYNSSLVGGELLPELNSTKGTAPE
jgi:predicted dehydrogenase